MAFSTTIKHALNRLLAVANLKVETLTLTRLEARRKAQLVAASHFSHPVFPVPRAFSEARAQLILDALPQFRARFDTFRDPAANEVGFAFTNAYFTSPDAEVFYTLVRTRRPARIIEVGSGNSTKVARQAIMDGQLNTHLLSIDPQPRVQIDSLADECVRQPVERAELALFDTLVEGDMLFIDSSHELKPGNDVVFLFLNVLPRLKPGVLVHVHDIYLPYEYRREVVLDFECDWLEQYLVQAVLMSSDLFEVLWAGHFWQRTLRDFSAHFPNLDQRVATSLWFQKRG